MDTLRHNKVFLNGNIPVYCKIHLDRHVPNEYACQRVVAAGEPQDPWTSFAFPNNPRTVLAYPLHSSTSLTLTLSTHADAIGRKTQCRARLAQYADFPAFTAHTRPDPTFTVHPW